MTQAVALQRGHSPYPELGLKCPKCGSTRIWKDGTRKLSDGSKVQRYLCRECCYRFTDPTYRKRSNNRRYETKRLNTALLLSSIDDSRRSRVREENGLEKKPLSGKRPAGGVEDLDSLLFRFGWWLRKQGYADETIKGRVKLLRTLARCGANLYDPETVKKIIAKQSWSPNRKALAVTAYSSFLKMVGGTWEPPRYKRVKTLPFIPTERELDDLIAGCNQKMATFLQLLKETGVRSGEAWKLRWEDIDLERGVVRVTPEKGGEPRIFKISRKLVEMLDSLPRTSDKPFGNGLLRNFRRSFRRQRKRIAHKLKNPRILKITFHTFRHWKATMEYHKTKDIIHVMKVLGHRNINNTLIYITLEEALFQGGSDEYYSAVARTVQEARKLIEAGFEYVCEFEGVKLFRKRK